MDNIVGHPQSIRIRVGEHHPVLLSIQKTKLTKLLTPAAFARLKEEHPKASDKELHQKVITNIAASFQIPTGNFEEDTRTSDRVKLERLVDSALRTYHKVCHKLGITPPKTTISCDSRTLASCNGLYYVAVRHIGIDLNKFPVHPFATLLHEIGHIQATPPVYKYGDQENKNHFVLHKFGQRFSFYPIADQSPIYSLRGISEFVAESFKLMGLKLLGYKEERKTITPEYTKVNMRKVTMDSSLNQVEKTLLGIYLLLSTEEDSRKVLSNSQAKKIKKTSCEKEKTKTLNKIYHNFISQELKPTADQQENGSLKFVFNREQLRNQKVITEFHMSKEIDPEQLAAGLSAGDLNTADVMGSSSFDSRNEKVNSHMSYWTIVETFKKFAIEIYQHESENQSLTKKEKEVAVEHFVKIAYQAQLKEHPRIIINELKKICSSQTELKLMLSFGKVHAVSNLTTEQVSFDELISELWFLVREIKSPEKRELATYFLLNLNILGPKDCHIEMNYI